MQTQNQITENVIKKGKYKGTVVSELFASFVIHICENSDRDPVSVQLDLMGR
jgi:hypothetical protein